MIILSEDWFIKHGTHRPVPPRKPEGQEQIRSRMEQARVCHEERLQLQELEEVTDPVGLSFLLSPFADAPSTSDLEPSPSDRDATPSVSYDATPDDSPSILCEARKLVDIYCGAVATIKSHLGIMNTEKVALAEDSLAQIKVHLSEVKNDFSIAAATLEKQLCDALRASAQELSCFYIGDQEIAALISAVTIAKKWSLLPKKRGFLPFLNKDSKKASEGSYLTYSDAIQDPAHQRILCLSRFPEASTVLHLLSDVVQRLRHCYTSLSEEQSPAQDRGISENAMKKAMIKLKTYTDQLEKIHHILHFQSKYPIPFVELTECIALPQLRRILNHTASEDDYDTLLNETRFMRIAQNLV